MRDLETRYLERLAELYPTIAAASTEVINLEAILNLPKGTEHFLTDIHGEYEAFAHVLKNGSGAVRRKVADVFGNTLSNRDKQSLATLIYYPREKMAQILKTAKNPEDWYKITLYRLIEISKRASSKYTRSKVRKALPPEFAYVIEELITEKVDVRDKESYYNAIVNTIIRVDRARECIIAMCELIQRLTVDHLHILGDIYDRGPGPHIIICLLYTSMVNAFGAAAAPMGFGEVYTAIQQGVIDGAENNELALTNNKHGEVAKYYCYNKHQLTGNVIWAWCVPEAAPWKRVDR